MDPEHGSHRMVAPGPFKAAGLKSGDPYELSRGHAVFVAPTGMAGARRQGLGYQVLASDPDAVGVAIDPGISTEPGMLRAPALALGVGDGPGWDSKAPPLAVEYAERGQDEDELQAKIAELLLAGTRIIWVVRLVGPRRVEVYEPGRPVEVVGGAGTLVAPGLLRNPVAVASLYDEALANEVALRNLVQRHGYAGLDEVRAEGREEGARVALRELVSARFGPLDAVVGARLERGSATQVLAWIRRAAVASTLDEVFVD